MKHKFYTFVNLCAFLLVAHIPLGSVAQCNCADGEPATPIHYRVILDSSRSNLRTISFPKFDPSIGTLSCLLITDTTSAVSITHVQNTAPMDVRYRFRLTVSTNLTGPGIGIGEVSDQLYGPDTLRTYGDPGDTITYGPDTMYNQMPHSTVITTNVADYMGAGNVDLDFEISGGLTSLQGGLNFISQINTYTWGVFDITYYWCPTALLAQNIINFSAIKKDHNIQLTWSVTNEDSTNSYEIQISSDGQHFVSIGKTPGRYASEGSTAEYRYEYLPDQPLAGKRYFRIRQKDAAGQTSHSPVRLINLDDPDAASVLLYPNPVKRQVSLQFDRIVNSRFAVDIVSAGGHLLQQRVITVNNVNFLQFDLEKQLIPGLYYLRARDLTTGKTYLNKMLVQ